MTQKNNLTTPQIQFSLTKRMLAGAGAGLLLISTFLLSLNEPDPEWGKLWMIRPLIMVPLAGAAAGLCNYLLLYFHHQIGINKTVAILLSVVIFIIGLYSGIVLGLDGTMWN